MLPSRLSGISRYTIDDEARVVQQRDFWDSVNLESGVYEEKPRTLGIADFIMQLRPQPDPLKAAAREAPSELLRRAKTYQVRKYGALKGLSTTALAGAEGNLTPERVIHAEEKIEGYAAAANAARGRAEFVPCLPYIVKYELDGGDALLGRASLATAGTKCEIFGPIRGPGPDWMPILPKPTDPTLGLSSSGSSILASAVVNDPGNCRDIETSMQKLVGDLQKDGLLPREEGELCECVPRVFVTRGMKLSRLRHDEVWIPLPPGTHPWQALEE